MIDVGSACTLPSIPLKLKAFSLTMSPTDEQVLLETFQMIEQGVRIVRYDLLPWKPCVLLLDIEILAALYLLDRSPHHLEIESSIHIGQVIQEGPLMAYLKSNRQSEGN